MARLDPMFGLLLPLDGVSSLTTIGAGTFESAYTEAGPGPGVWTPALDETWTVNVSGDQTTAIGVYCVRGGFPDRNGAMVIVRTEATSTFYGWSEPNCITRFTVPDDYTVDTFGSYALATNSITQEVVMVAHKATGSAIAWTWKYDPKTLTWTTGYEWATGPGLDAPIAMAEDPNKPGRILLWGGRGAAAYSEDTVAFYSDDSGATWERFTQGYFNDGQANTIGRAAVGVDPSNDWVMFTHGVGANTTAQYASSDHGVSWEVVEADIDAELFATGASARLSVARGPRGYVVAYRTNTDGFPAVKVLNSARASFSDATEIVLSFYGTDQKCDDVIVATDADGAVYAFVFVDTTTGSARDGTVAVYRSDDGGSTWTPYRRLLWGTSTADTAVLDKPVVTFAGGQAIIGGICPGSLTMGIVCAGGWENITAGSAQVETVNREYRFGFVKGDTTTGDVGVAYIPLDTFTNMGWTFISTGTETLANGGSTFTATAGQSVAAAYVLDTSAKDYVCGQARVKLLQGESRVTSDVYIGQALQDGVGTGVEMRIYLGTNGYEVRDGASTVRASWSADGTTTDKWVEFRWMVRRTGGSAFATVWRRLAEPGDADTWTAIASDVALTSSGSVSTTFVIGVVAGVGITSEAVFQTLASAIGGDWRSGIEDVEDLDLTPANGVRGITLSRPLPPKGYSYPLPLLSDIPLDAGYISGSGGPAYVEQWGRIPVGYQYPIEATDPRESPSPSIGWRATDTTEVEMVFNAGEPVFRGGALALVALRATFATAEIAVDDGSGGWGASSTLDKSASVTYTKNGADVRPSGAGVISRYIHENELAGGYFIFPTGGGAPDLARRIVKNSGGYFAATSGQPLRITIDGQDGSEDASGTGTLVYPSGVLIVYPSIDSARRYIRIRIPAAQVVPADGGTDGATSAYGAGLLFVARVVGIGTEPDWSHTRTVQLPASVSRRRDGSPAMVRTGPARRKVEYSFASSAAVKMRSTAASPNHIAASGGLAIGTDQDAWSVLPAVVDSLEGAPAVVVPRLPATGQTLTDPTHFMYGLATQDSLTLTYSSGGTEGVDEIVAVGGLVVEEVS